MESRESEGCVRAMTPRGTCGTRTRSSKAASADVSFWGQQTDESTSLDMSQTPEGAEERSGNPCEVPLAGPSIDVGAAHRGLPSSPEGGRWAWTASRRRNRAGARDNLRNLHERLGPSGIATVDPTSARSEKGRAGTVRRIRRVSCSEDAAGGSADTVFGFARLSQLVCSQGHCPLSLRNVHSSDRLVAIPLGHSRSCRSLRLSRAPARILLRDAVHAHRRLLPETMVASVSAPTSMRWPASGTSHRVPASLSPLPSGVLWDMPSDVDASVCCLQKLTSSTGPPCSTGPCAARSPASSLVRSLRLPASPSRPRSGSPARPTFTVGACSELGRVCRSNRPQGLVTGVLAPVALVKERRASR